MSLKHKVHVCRYIVLVQTEGARRYSQTIDSIKHTVPMELT